MYLEILQIQLIQVKKLIKLLFQLKNRFILYFYCNLNHLEIKN